MFGFAEAETSRGRLSGTDPERTQQFGRFSKFFIPVLERIRSRVWLGIAVGLLLTATGLLLRLALPGIPESKTPYLTFYPLSTVAAVLGGWTGGVATAAFSTFVVVYAFAGVAQDDLIAAAIYFSNGVLATGIVEILYHGKMQAIRAEAAKEALARRAARDELLSRAAAGLLQSGDPEIIVHELSQEVMAFLECQVFFNLLLDERSGRFYVNACGGISEEEASKMLDLDCAACGCMAGNIKRRIAEDIGASNDRRTERLRPLGIRCYCCHPLIEQGRVIGVLMFGDRMRSRFDPSAIETMEAVSRLMSLALGRMRMESALRDADRRKDEFLATLAHELRNPLAPIRTGLHVLRKTGGQEPSAEKIRGMMERQVDHLVCLVDDLLEVSRIRCGRIELKKERLDLGNIIQNAAEASRQHIDANNLELLIDLADAPLQLDADPVRLTQVFVNLLNNAAKYTNEGGRVEIRAERQCDAAIVTVADTGVGIPADMLPRVFDLFAQVDRTLGRAQGGLGIGLALVRKLVELHAGKVEAFSDGEGKGSRFVLRLPLAAAADNEASPRARAEAPALVSARRVLVVDDTRDVADSFAILLETLGAEVRIAYDGAQGLDELARFNPSVVFLDIGMPGMDGFETARRMRASTQGRDVTLIALTGWGAEETRKMVEAEGFDRHLVKPAQLDEVQRALESTL
jgi:signal transduction histidine kinase/CheY-like chemotaxis protein